MPSKMVACTGCKNTLAAGTNTGCSGPSVDASFDEAEIVSVVTTNGDHITECYIVTET